VVASEEHLPSLGFADDTNVLANTLANLCILHEWVLYFMRFSLMQLNHSKCELVGRGADGAPVTEAAVAAAGIAIDGHSLIPLAQSTPIRYLGVHCCFDGDWSAQHRKLLATLQLFRGAKPPTSTTSEAQATFKDRRCSMDQIV